MNIKFWIDCDPPRTTYSAHARIFRRKSGQPFICKDKKAADVRRTLGSDFGAYAPASPCDGPCAVVVTFAHPFLKGHTKKVVGSHNFFKTTRPDCDNVAKLLMDALQDAGFVTDDARCACMTIVKMYSDQPGIGIHIWETAPDCASLYAKGYYVNEE